MKLSAYLREMADKIDKNVFTKSDIISIISELIKEFYHVPDYISECKFTRKDEIEK